MKDEFQSNIVIDRYNGFSFEFSDYEWFNSKGKNTSYNDFLWICYAIKTYFDGDILYDFDGVSRRVDVVLRHMTTNVYVYLECVWIGI